MVSRVIGNDGECSRSHCEVNRMIQAAHYNGQQTVELSDTIKSLHNNNRQTAVALPYA
jgi:hypothetical protein